MKAALLAVCILLLTPDLLHAELYERKKPQLPDPLGYVSDHAQALDQEWKARIRSVCQDLERKTGVEMVVVTVRGIKPYPTVNEYADALFERWGIGTAQQDHGVLVLAAVEERAAAITVGRGLIPIVTPQVLQEVSGKYVEPAMRSGRYGEGLYRTAVVIATAAQDVRIGAPMHVHAKGLGFWITLVTIVSGLWFLWWISRPDKRHPFGRLRRGEYWGSGQGGFGGNFGGFGGGTSGEGLT